MQTAGNRLSWHIWNPISASQTLVLVSVVAAVSYVAPKLEGAVILHSQTVWPPWPGCALLVSVLLLVRKKIWLALIPTALAGFLLYDLQTGVPLRSVAWFILADTVEVLIAGPLSWLRFRWSASAEYRKEFDKVFPLCGGSGAVRCVIHQRAWHRR